MGAAAGRAAPGPAALGARRAERPVRVTSPPPGSSWFGHPRGLSTLFITEMWERFSYYGMRGFLILYMTKALGFTDPHAGAVYGNYVGSVWVTPILGGLIADRWLGQYRSVLIGGIIIALGHFTLVFHALPFFYVGLTLIVIGTGLLKPNVSAMVGATRASRSSTWGSTWARSSDRSSPGSSRRDSIGISGSPAPAWGCSSGWCSMCSVAGSSSRRSIASP